MFSGLTLWTLRIRSTYSSASWLAAMRKVRGRRRGSVSPGCGVGLVGRCCDGGCTEAFGEVDIVGLGPGDRRGSPCTSAGCFSSSFSDSLESENMTGTMTLFRGTGDGAAAAFATPLELCRRRGPMSRDRADASRRSTGFAEATGVTLSEVGRPRVDRFGSAIDASIDRRFNRPAPVFLRVAIPTVLLTGAALPSSVADSMGKFGAREHSNPV